MKRVLSFITVLIILLLSGCIDKYRQEYENKLNNALDKPYNELDGEEQDMVDKYIEWEVENQ